MDLLPGDGGGGLLLSKLPYSTVQQEGEESRWAQGPVSWRQPLEAALGGSPCFHGSLACAVDQFNHHSVTKKLS